MTQRSELEPFFRADKKKLFQTSFYKSQRIKFNILIDENQKPDGGKWTYDDQNREKYPKNKTTPEIELPKKPKNHNEVIEYINKYFPDNYGELSKISIYPTDFKSAKKWFIMAASGGVKSAQLNLAKLYLDEAKNQPENKTRHCIVMGFL